MVSLDKSIRSLGDVVNVLEHIRYKQKGAIETHEPQLQSIADSLEEIDSMTSRLMTRLSELKVKECIGKRMSYGLLLPFEYYVTAIEETFSSVLTMAAMNKANQRLLQYAENIGTNPLNTHSLTHL